MTKKNRLKLIREIIENNTITTQEDLLKHLEIYHVAVTQTTISRDLSELNLSKTRNSQGVYYYSLPQESPKGEFVVKFKTIFKESVISLVNAGNILVIKCYTGMGNAACAALDSMSFNEIMGTIAGDDTIFAATGTTEKCDELIVKLDGILKE